MRKTFTIFCLAIMPFLMSSAFAQDTIIAWTFPAGSADAFADYPAASPRFISFEQPANQGILISYVPSGESANDSCAQVTGLENLADSVFWMIKTKTVNCSNLKLYSKQWSSADGPRDFKLQYMLKTDTAWKDLSTIVCASDWTTGVVNGIDIPAECNNLNSQTSFRFLMSSNTSVDGGTVSATGVTKIDDIIITGLDATGIEDFEANTFVNVYPNPSKGNIFIENNGEIAKIAVYNVLGKCIYTSENSAESRTELTGFEKGMYIVQIISNHNRAYSQKLIVE